MEKSKLEYLPSLTAVFLDDQTLEYLSGQFDWELWNSFEKKLRSVFPTIPIVVRTNEKLDAIFSDNPGLQNTKRISTAKSELEFLSAISLDLPPSQFSDPDWDEVCFLYFTGISPVLDSALLLEGWQRHKRYFSQYSYSENIPLGLIPQILTREFLSSLPESLNTDVHSFFLKNINQFDVDIFFKPPDLRQLRLDFRYRSRRSEELIRSLLQAPERIPYEKIREFFEKESRGYRPFPSYLEWEVYKGCELSCIFCPRTFIGKEDDGSAVSLADVTHVISKLNEELRSPITICLGGNGEPLLHPRITEVINEIFKLKMLNELVIETAAYTNTDAFLSFLKSLDKSLLSKLTLIVNCSSLNRETYQSLYGRDHLESVLVTIDAFSKVLGSNSLYVQMIKMGEVENEVDGFFTNFENKGIQVILQKYNSYTGKMKERRVSDLTPIQRDFCWHLNRDLFLLHNGTVSICKQETNHVIGNLYSESLETIWDRGLTYFRESFLGNHAAIPAPCLQCDEWYTFNA